MRPRETSPLRSLILFAIFLASFATAAETPSAKFQGAWVEEKSSAFSRDNRRALLVGLVDANKIEKLTVSQEHLYAKARENKEKGSLELLPVLEALRGATSPATSDLQPYDFVKLRERLAALDDTTGEAVIIRLSHDRKITGMSAADQAKYLRLAETKTPTGTAAEKKADQEADARIESIIKNLALYDAAEKSVTVAKPNPYILQFLHTGAALMNPYSTAAGTTPGTLILSSNNTEVAGFIEYVVTNRLAWNPGRLDDIRRENSDTYGTSSQGYFVLFYDDLLKPNFDVRLNATFGGTDTTANAILGTGDFGCEFSLGVPLVLSNNRGYAWSFGPEFSHSIVTSKKDFEAINRSFFGASFELAYDNPFVPNTRVLFRSRFGYALVDSIQFSNPALLEIKTTFGSRPQYSLRDSMALEMELIHPVTDGSALTIGMKFYSWVEPNTWMASIGYTISTDKLLDALFSKDSRGGPWKKP